MGHYLLAQVIFGQFRVTADVVVAVRVVVVTVEDTGGLAGDHFQKLGAECPASRATFCRSRAPLVLSEGEIFGVGSCRCSRIGLLYLAPIMEERDEVYR